MTPRNSGRRGSRGASRVGWCCTRAEATRRRFTHQHDASDAALGCEEGEQLVELGSVVVERETSPAQQRGAQQGLHQRPACPVQLRRQRLRVRGGQDAVRQPAQENDNRFAGPCLERDELGPSCSVEHESFSKHREGELLSALRPGGGSTRRGKPCDSGEPEDGGGEQRNGTDPDANVHNFRGSAHLLEKWCSRPGSVSQCCALPRVSSNGPHRRTEAPLQLVLAAETVVQAQFVTTSELSTIRTSRDNCACPWSCATEASAKEQVRPALCPPRARVVLSERGKRKRKVGRSLPPRHPQLGRLWRARCGGTQAVALPPAARGAPSRRATIDPAHV